MKYTIFKYSATVIILLTIVLWHHHFSFAQSPVMSIQDLLRFRIESGGAPLKITVGTEPIHAAIVLPIFYESRVYQPAWTNSQGFLPKAEALLNAIRRADREGLRPGDYHLEKIEAILSELRKAPELNKKTNLNQLVDLDLLLTDAFLIYGSHLNSGRTDPEQIHPRWFVNRREGDLIRLLDHALTSNQIEETLAALLPVQAGYKHLRDTLVIYCKFAKAGGWPTVSSGKKLQ
jgi:murein L,D-transpeptidase YcbB/YkuD